MIIKQILLTLANSPTSPCLTQMISVIDPVNLQTEVNQSDYGSSPQIPPPAQALPPCCKVEIPPSVLVEQAPSQLTDPKKVHSRKKITAKLICS